LRKPLVVGPHVWTIEYPFVEHGAALAEKVVEPIEDFGSRIDLFLKEHSGAIQRTLDAIDAVLAARAGVYPKAVSHNHIVITDDPVASSTLEAATLLARPYILAKI
jgi:hypothetical protein